MHLVYAATVVGIETMKGEATYPEKIENGEYGVDEDNAHSSLPSCRDEQMDKEADDSVPRPQYQYLLQTNPYEGQQLSRLIIMAALPILYFNFFKVEGRMAYGHLLIELPPRAILLAWLPCIFYVVVVAPFYSVLVRWLHLGMFIGGCAGCLLGELVFRLKKKD